MPVYFQWYDDDKTILVEHLEGRWQCHEYTAMIDAENEELRTVPHQVDVIMETSNAKNIPNDFMVCAMYAAKEVSYKINLSIFVVKLPFVKALINNVLVIFPHLTTKIFFVGTFDEALDIIHNQRKTSND